MARCEICHRSGQSGNRVSFSMRHTRHRWHVNVQKATIDDKGVRRRVKICTRCLRTQYKARVRA